MILAAAAFAACQAADRATAPVAPVLASIVIDTPSLVLERGSRVTLSATVRSREGARVDAPVVWQSGDSTIATFSRGGVLTARDTGVTSIVAASASVVSAAVPVRVVWVGPATIARGPWRPPSALNPGATLRDSVRVLVTNIAGAPVANAVVAFRVVSGGGSVAPRTASTSASGIAASQWTLGPAVGTNTIEAAVLRADGAPDSLVARNSVLFVVASYQALRVEAGDGQTQQILSAVPVSPRVRLVDSLGAPRRGVPVQFTPSAGGRVSLAVVSTNAEGLASPGEWSLGDLPGAQHLTASVEDAVVTLAATATGVPIHYSPAAIAAGAFSTCALEALGAIRCWGQSPQNGSADTSVTAPSGLGRPFAATAIVGGPSHFCALTQSATASCWGVSAALDSTGQPVSPVEAVTVAGSLPWLQVAAGGAHNCALAADHSAWCWGINSTGQLGTRDTLRRVAPALVTGAFAFTRIAAGAAHSCALATDGAAFCWGMNQAGQLGDGTTQSRLTPTAVAGSLTFREIGAGNAFTCGLTMDGRAWCWGTLGGAAQPVPVTWPAAPPFAALSVGGEHACALTADGVAMCWGSNAFGQLGDSTFTARAAPVAVAGGFRFSTISAGQQHTCALVLDGAVTCWGLNRAGELGDRHPASRAAPAFVVLGVVP